MYYKWCAHKKKSVILEEYVSEFKSTDAEQGVDLKYLLLATKLQNMNVSNIDSDFVKQKTNIEACLKQLKYKLCKWAIVRKL